MADESPLITRIRGRSRSTMQDTPMQASRPRFPRKGLLRLLLVVVIIIAGSKMVGSRLRSTNADAPGLGATVAADSLKKNRASGATERDAKKKAAKSASVNRKIGGSLTTGEVADLLGVVNPEFTASADTIACKGSSVVAYYSINPAMQVFIRDIMKAYKPRYGAAVVMDPVSGRVLALASYRNDSVPDRGADLYLRTIFPAASIFKTVTAAAAFEKGGYTAERTIPITGRNHTLYKFQLKKEIKSVDSISFAEAFAKSINPVFARIGMYVLGRNVLEDYSRRFGFNAAIPFELHADTSKVIVPIDTSYQMAEFASGFNRSTTLSPLHGALIAGAVANNGIMPFPHVVDSVCRKSDGARLYASDQARWKTSMTPAAARELRAMMNRVVHKGTARKSFRCLNSCYWSAGIDYGGKTGSIEADSLGKVDWFIGFVGENGGESSTGLAVAVVTTHGSMWTVHSSYIASEIFRKYCKPESKSLAARSSDSGDGRNSATAVPGKPKG